MLNLSSRNIGLFYHCPQLITRHCGKAWGVRKTYQINIYGCCSILQRLFYRSVLIHFMIFSRTCQVQSLTKWHYPCDMGKGWNFPDWQTTELVQAILGWLSESFTWAPSCSAQDSVNTFFSHYTRHKLLCLTCWSKENFMLNWS